MFWLWGLHWRGGWELCELAYVCRTHGSSLIILVSLEPWGCKAVNEVSDKVKRIKWSCTPPCGLCLVHRGIQYRSTFGHVSCGGISLEKLAQLFSVWFNCWLRFRSTLSQDTVVLQGFAPQVFMTMCLMTLYLTLCCVINGRIRVFCWINFTVLAQKPGLLWLYV